MPDMLVADARVPLADPQDLLRRLCDGLPEHGMRTCLGTGDPGLSSQGRGLPRGRHLVAAYWRLGYDSSQAHDLD